MTHSPTPLDYERDALRQLLQRLMQEESSLDALCRHAPRIVSVAANVARIEAALQAGKESDEIDTVRRALRELTTEMTNEEESSW